MVRIKSVCEQSLTSHLIAYITSHFKTSLSRQSVALIVTYNQTLTTKRTYTKTNKCVSKTQSICHSVCLYLSVYLSINQYPPYGGRHSTGRLLARDLHF